MEGLLEFLTDNPFLAIILLVWLFNALFGRKKEDPKKNVPQAKPRQNMPPAQAPQAPASSGNSVRDLIAEAERRMREALEQADVDMQRQSRAVKAKVAEQAAPKPVAQKTAAPASGNDPYEFHALDTATRATEDYDLRTGAYEYHSAVEGPADRVFHTGGFNTFQAAQGLSHDKPKRSAPEAPKPAPTDAHPLAGILSRPDDLKRMFILKEILDKPKALR